MGDTTVCSVAGCGKRHEAKGLCQNHYMMLRRRGTTVATKRGHGTAYGAVYTKPNGYTVRKMPDHPLAAPSSGLVYEHRRVMYDLLGPGPHPCHWCGVMLDWPDAECDHLDTARSNNVPSNLVFSCHDCNTRRVIPSPEALAARLAALDRGREAARLASSRPREMRACVLCCTEVERLPSDRRVFCSRRCASIKRERDRRAA
jgi:hypothetical protein